MIGLLLKNGYSKNACVWRHFHIKAVDLIKTLGEPRTFLKIRVKNAIKIHYILSNRPEEQKDK